MSWLEQCGLRAAINRLEPGNASNIKGHFEDIDIMTFHRQVIRRRRQSSQGWIYPVRTPIRLTKTERQDLESILQQRPTDHRPWGWKDPRTCLFLPTWRERFPHMVLVGVWRPCQQVVRSLTARFDQTGAESSKISRLAATRLWVSHNQLMLKALDQETQPLLFTHNQFAKHDRAIFEQINSRMDGALKFVPFSKVFDKSLIHQEKPVSPSNQILNRLTGVRQVTRALDAATCRLL